MDNTLIVVALIGGIPATISALAAYRAGRKADTAVKKIDDVHMEVRTGNAQKLGAENAEKGGT